MLFLTFVKIFHLLGLILGLGGAVLLDFTIFSRGVIRPISKFTVHQVEFLSRIVTWGLVVLWVSGIALIWMNLADKPEYLTNQKLWAKIAIVAVLTLNGVLIHHKVLPVLKQKIGQRLFELANAKEIAAMTLVGGISVTSWVAPFVLGKASELNYVTSIWTIWAYYVLGLSVMWVGIFTLMKSIAFLQQLFTTLVASTMRPSEVWENLDLPRANLIPAYVKKAPPRGSFPREVKAG